MSKIHIIRKFTDTAQRAEAAPSVLKFSFKNIPAVDAKKWAEIKAAARKPSKGRHYPVLIEVPDGSL